MHIEEFFAALEKTPRDWMDDRGAIRRQGAFCEQCPLTAVAGFGERESFWTYAHAGYWKSAAREIRLPAKDALKIVSAADGRGHLRKRLLAACGFN